MAKQIILNQTTTPITPDIGNNTTIWNDSSQLRVGYKGTFVAPYSSPQVAILTYDGAFTHTANTWTTVPIDTKSYDPDTLVTLASNQFTLGSGLYWVKATNVVDAGGAGNTGESRLYNVTESKNALGYNSAGIHNKRMENTTIFGELVLTSAKAFEVQVLTSVSRTISDTTINKILIEVWKWGDIVTPSTQYDIAGLTLKPSSRAETPPSNDIYLFNQGGVVQLESNDSQFGLPQGGAAVLASFQNTWTFAGGGTWQTLRFNKVMQPQPFLELDTDFFSFTLQKGKYELFSDQSLIRTNSTSMRIYDVKNGIILSGTEEAIETHYDNSAGDRGHGVAHHVFELAEATELELQIAAGDNQASAITDIGNLMYIRRL